jgi:hypothetical protein
MRKQLYQPWYNSLSVPDLVFTKLLLIPPLALQGPGQHGSDFVQQERPRWPTVPTADHPEASPLDPLAEIVCVQHPPEQAIFRKHIDLVDTACRLSLLLRLLLLLACCRSPDLAQVVIVEHVAEKSPGPDDKSNLHRPVSTAPVIYSRRTVSSEPPADGDSIEHLERERHGPDNGVNG